MTLIFLLLIPVCAGLLCLVTRSHETWERLNLLAFAALVPLALKIGADVLAEGPVSALGGFLRADALSALVIGLTVFVALACSIYSVGYFRARRPRWQNHRSAITPLPRAHAAVCGRHAARAAGRQPRHDVGGHRKHHARLCPARHVLQPEDLVRGRLEIHHHRQRRHFPRAVRDRVHLLLGGQRVGRGCASRHELVACSSELRTSSIPTAMRLAFIMVLLGYGTKAGLAPMHTWKPDAYAEAPVPTAALLGAAFINCAIYAIVRFDVLAVKCLGPDFPGKLLAGFGVALHPCRRAVHSDRKGISAASSPIRALTTRASWPRRSALAANSARSARRCT